MADGRPIDRFLRSFVLPLVAGGHVEVRGLVGPGMLQSLTDGQPPDATLLADIAHHVRAHLARIGPVAWVELLPPDALGLAAVWHNLIAMTHPDVMTRARLRKRVRQWSAQMLEWIGVPRSANEVALRHGVLARLGQIGRVDTDVVFWAGSAKFVGVAPPRRLLVWRSVRRVRENKVRIPFYELLQDLRSDTVEIDLLEPARIALALSPLTDIALADRPVALTHFQWTNASVNALADAPLRGATIRLVLGRGDAITDNSLDRTNQRIRLVEQATRNAIDAGIPATAAKVLVAFHLELLVTDALSRGEPLPSHALPWDLGARLGSQRAADIAGLPVEEFERTLGLHLQSRPPLKDAPAVPLLARAGLVEVSS